MKLLLAFLGFAILAHNGIQADKALADKLKPFEAFSPYEWTKWIELRPPQGHYQPQPLAVASVAISPARPASDDSDEDEDDDESLEVVSPFDQWFKRAILPQPPVTKKPKKLKDPSATKKPKIVAVPLDYWSPPPSVAPNVTLPPPPGYYAAKKSMFISKLFAALAASVLNETGPIAPEDSDVATTTVSPRQAILDEIQTVLLSDVARSLPADDDDTDSDETTESDEDSDEATPAPIKLTLAEQLAAFRFAAVNPTAAKPAAKPAVPTTTTTENPFLLKRLDFLEKLTAAVLAQPTAPLAPIPTKAAPVLATTPAPYKGKPVKGKAGKKAKGKKAPATPKPPKYLKYLPTTTTTVAPPEIDYDALAQALLSGSGK